jgi:hypothetical protein
LHRQFALKNGPSHRIGRPIRTHLPSNGFRVDRRFEVLDRPHATLSGCHRSKIFYVQWNAMLCMRGLVSPTHEEASKNESRVEFKARYRQNSLFMN